MNGMNSRALDAHITGANIHFEDDGVRHVCATCGRIRLISMFYEWGGWFYSPQGEEEAWCEDCEQNLVIVEAK